MASAKLVPPPGRLLGKISAAAVAPGQIQVVEGGRFQVEVPGDPHVGQVGDPVHHQARRPCTADDDGLPGNGQACCVQRCLLLGRQLALIEDQISANARVSHINGAACCQAKAAEVLGNGKIAAVQGCTVPGRILDAQVVQEQSAADLRTYQPNRALHGHVRTEQIPAYGQ